MSGYAADVGIGGQTFVLRPDIEPHGPLAQSVFVVQGWVSWSLQAPPASQMWVPEQVPTSSALETVWQAPSLPGRLQALQTPSQASAQQTWSVQWSLLHS